MIPLFAPKPEIQTGNNLKQDRQFENELVGALKKREVHAMELLQQTYSAPLYGIIRRIVQDDFGAETVLQLSLKRTWDSIEQFDPAKQHLFTWMVSLARMVACTELEDQQIQEKQQIHKAEPGTVSLRVVHAAGETHDKNGKRKLADFIEPKYRMMLNLIYFQGFSVEEISTRFSLPVQEVKLRLALAIRQLRAGCSPE